MCFRILSIKFLGKRGVAARRHTAMRADVLSNVYKNTIKRNIKNVAVYMGMMMIRQNSARNEICIYTYHSFCAILHDII